jgi:hypothetical protein
VAREAESGLEVGAGSRRAERGCEAKPAGGAGRIGRFMEDGATVGTWLALDVRVG